MQIFFVIIVIDYRIKGVEKMNNFDLSWFTTLPGLLITGGVLLLIIALIVLVITGKKSKKEKKAQEETTPTDQNAMAAPEAVAAPAADPMAAQPAMPEAAPVDIATPVVDPMAAPMVEQPAMPEAAPVDIATPVVDPMAAPMVEQPVMPEAAPVDIATPVVDPMAAPMVEQPAMPEAAPVDIATPVVDPMAAPMVEQPVMPEAAPVDAAVPATERVGRDADVGHTETAQRRRGTMDVAQGHLGPAEDLLPRLSGRNWNFQKDRQLPEPSALQVQQSPYHAGHILSGKKEGGIKKFQYLRKVRRFAALSKRSVLLFNSNI